MQSLFRHFLLYICIMILPGLYNPHNEWSPDIYNHCFIHGPLSHAVWRVMNDWLANGTSNLHGMTKTPQFTWFKWPVHKLTNQTTRQWCSLTQSKNTVKPPTTMPRSFKKMAIGQPFENFDILINLLWPCQCFIMVFFLNGKH